MKNTSSNLLIFLLTLNPFQAAPGCNKLIVFLFLEWNQNNQRTAYISGGQKAVQEHLPSSSSTLSFPKGFGFKNGDMKLGFPYEPEK